MKRQVNFSQFVAALKAEVDRVFEFNIVELTVGEMLAEAKSEDSDDTVISLETLQMISFGFLYAAFPSASAIKLWDKLHPLEYADDTRLLSDLIWTTALQQAGLGPHESMTIPQRGQITAKGVELVRSFFTLLHEVRSDEILATLDVDDLSDEEEEIYEPCFFRVADEVNWNDRWGKLVTDARYLGVLGGHLGVLPPEARLYPSFLVMRFAALRESLKLDQFNELVGVIVDAFDGERETKEKEETGAVSEPAKSAPTLN